MFKEERIRKIAEALLEKHKVICTELAQEFSVSLSTIRLDLTELEKRGLAQRTYGGAVLPEKHTDSQPLITEPLLADRVKLNVAEKEAIGRAAAELIHEGETIMIDGGTTTPFVCRNLKDKGNLTVVTSAAGLLSELLALLQVDIFLVGGYVRRENLSLVGEVAETMVNRFRANKVILGIDGISLEHGLTTINFLEAGVKRQMIAASQQLIIVADHTKLDRVCLVPVVPLERLDILVTDALAPPETVARMRQRGIEVILAPLHR